MNDYGNNQEDSRIYTVNPFCPICGEEHCYYDVKLTETEESTLRDYYRDKSDLTDLALRIEEMANPPLVIRRKFKCGACHKEFEKNVVVFRSRAVKKLSLRQ